MHSQSDTLSTATLAARLESEEREYRARKTQRAFRGLAEACDQLRERMAGRRDVKVVWTERSVTIDTAWRKRFELGLRLSFEHDGTMQQWFMVRERTVDEHTVCDEVDFETVFVEMSEAIGFIVGSVGRAPA